MTGYPVMFRTEASARNFLEIKRNSEDFAIIRMSGVEEVPEAPATEDVE